MSNPWNRPSSSPATNDASEFDYCVYPSDNLPEARRPYHKRVVYADEMDESYQFPSLLKHCLFVISNNMGKYSAEDISYVPTDLKELLFAEVISKPRDGPILSSELEPFYDSDIRVLDLSFRNVQIKQLLRKLMERLNTLEEIYLPGLSVGNEMNDEQVRLILTGFPSLGVLDIGNCLGVRSPFSDMQPAPHLRCLKVNFLRQFCDTDVLTIAKQCPNLEEIHMDSTGVGVAALRALAEHSKQLIGLSIQSCSKLNRFAVDVLVEDFPPLFHLWVDNTKFSGDQLLRIVTAHPNLVTFSCTSDYIYVKATDARAQASLICERLRNVTTLRMEDWRLEREQVSVIVNTCRKLTKLYLPGSMLLSGDLEIFDKLPGLEELDIGGKPYFVLDSSLWMSLRAPPNFEVTHLKRLVSKHTQLKLFRTKLRGVDGQIFVNST